MPLEFTNPARLNPSLISLLWSFLIRALKSAVEQKPEGKDEGQIGESSSSCFALSRYQPSARGRLSSYKSELPYKGGGGGVSDFFFLKRRMKTKIHVVNDIEISFLVSFNVSCRL